MYNLLVVAEESASVAELRSGLDRNGFLCSLAPYGEEAIEHIISMPPDVILMEMNGQPMDSLIELWRKMKQVKDSPVIALVHGDSLSKIDGHTEISDFVLEPYDLNEISLRIKRTLRSRGVGTEGAIQYGDLLIDTDRCEVFVAGKPVILTFREYELLKFLTHNRERVFTRQALLNKVWGYDYYGGDRTVDVHIRRLRSKIEESGRIFIETVRGIGYRFRINEKI